MARCELCGTMAKVELVQLERLSIEACSTCKTTIEELRRKEHAAKVYDTHCVFEV